MFLVIRSLKSLFQSTLSMRRATTRRVGCIMPLNGFQSTLSMRRATGFVIHFFPFIYISIHALHEESDHYRDGYRYVCQSISIHALHEESDLWNVAQVYEYDISIHALHEESDSAAGHFCPLFETQASCLALSISNNTADTTNNMSKTSNWLSVSF